MYLRIKICYYLKFYINQKGNNIRNSVLIIKFTVSILFVGNI